jgi:hypothetical protein
LDIEKFMTVADRILGLLVKQPLCDDCIAELLNLSDRQHANQVCRRLSDATKLSRSKMTCPHCSNHKFVNVVLSPVAPAENGIEERQPPIAAVPQASDLRTDIAPTDRPWHWEGFVQAKIVKHLTNDGFDIIRVADTESRESGTDIIAKSSHGRSLHVTVKGFSVAASKNTQARHYFADALLDLVMYRQRHPEADLALGIPAGIATYDNLLERVQWLKQNLPFAVYRVHEDGTVQVR